MISIGKETKDLIRYVILTVFLLVLLFVLRGFWIEVTISYLILVVLGMLTIDLSKEKSFVIDVFFLLLANGFGIFYNHLITTYDHYLLNSENYTSTVLYTISQGYEAVAIELMFISFLYIVLRVFTCPQKVAAVIAPFPTLLISVVDYFVYTFRGSEFTFFDIYNWKTAMNVVDNYEFDFSYPIIFALIPFVLYVFICISIKTPARNKFDKSQLVKMWIIPSGIYALSSILLITGIVNVVNKNASTMSTMWDDTLSMQIGYVTSFAYTVKNVKLQTPANYNAEDFARIAEYPTTETPDVNIIVVMNESYSDMSIYKDCFDSYIEPAPYWKELSKMENVRSGYVYTSAYGGLTANSEFEFLTGLTKAYMPYELTPYTTYIRDDIYSFPKYLSDLGYSTMAMHPYLASGWNRTNVYPAMGFDNYMFIDEFEFSDSDIVRGTEAFHNDAELISDKCAYENLLNLIDEDKDSKPNFYFLTTIQNHGGYNAALERFEVSEYVTGSNSDEELNVYLSNINRSDDALEYLVEELSSRDEKYVLLIFGDHQPNIDFWSDDSERGLALVDKVWQVPYLIWTNYDMPDEYEGTDIYTSINYFSLDLMNVSGIKYSEYFNKINEIRESLPVLCAARIYSKETESWRTIFEASEQDLVLISQYEKLRYYNLTDYSVK